jgi:hypothetical protein
MQVEELITRDSDILGGIPVFAGTRVPVKTLIDYLEQGIRWMCSSMTFQRSLVSRPSKSLLSLGKSWWSKSLHKSYLPRSR